MAILKTKLPVNIYRLKTQKAAKCHTYSEIPCYTWATEHDVILASKFGIPLLKDQFVTRPPDNQLFTHDP